MPSLCDGICQTLQPETRSPRALEPKPVSQSVVKRREATGGRPEPQLFGRMIARGCRTVQRSRDATVCAQIADDESICTHGSNDYEFPLPCVHPWKGFLDAGRPGEGPVRQGRTLFLTWGFQIRCARGACLEAKSRIREARSSQAWFLVQVRAFAAVAKAYAAKGRPAWLLCALWAVLGRFMGSYKWGYKSPNRVSNHSYPHL